MNTKVREFFFYFTSIVIIIAGIKFAKSVVILILLSVLFAVLFLSFLNFFRRYKIPDIISYFIIILTFIMLNSLIFIIITNSLSDFLQNLPLYQEKIKAMISLKSSFFGYEIKLERILQDIDFSAFIKYITGIFGNIGTILSKLILIMIGMTFIMIESKSFKDKLKIIFKNDSEKIHSLKLFSINIEKYFVAKTLTSLLTGILVTFMLVFFGIEYPILWGTIAFLFNFIPFIGSIVASIPAILLSFILVDIEISLVIIALYLAINIIVSNIIEPKVFGHELGLSPMVIFFSLIFWGWILGIAGMFLAVPISMTLKIAFDINKETKWLGILFSDVSKQRD